MSGQVGFLYPQMCVSVEAQIARLHACMHCAFVFAYLCVIVYAACAHGDRHTCFCAFIG